MRKTQNSFTIYIYKNKAPDLHIDSLEVAGGRSSQELVRISKDGSIPVYGNKSSVEYLLRYDNNRVPEYVKNRLTGEAVISDMQKAKDLEKKKEEDRWVMFVKNYFAAVRELPGFHNLNDRLGFETYPLINPASACPIIEVTVNTYINTIPVLFELTIRFMNQKNIVLSHLLISNHYLFDSEHLRLLQDLHKFNITDFPIIVSAINDGNNSTIRTEIIYYKQPNKLKNTATKDEIKKYISDYLTEIREYLENIEIEEEI